MAGERKTKIVGKRIDLSYPNRPAPLRTLRRVLVIVFGLGAALWGGWALWANGGERVYNPGPVTAQHVMFEHDCAACHDGGGGSGKFSKTVSDMACLKCHNGAIHSEKQVSLASMEGGRPVMSNNCVTCHVEHKGHEALAGASDLLCTRCHDNLTQNVAGGKTDMAASVKHFDAPAAHPAFGRVLKQGGQGAWTDPTPLKFNHKKHLTGITPSVGECATCHHTSTSGDRHIMRPVSYEENCKSCHALNLAPGLPDVPHERMELVRLYTASGPGLFAQRLAAMTPEEKEKALTITTERQQGLRKIKETKKVTEAEWLEAQAKDLEKKVAASPAANQSSYAAVAALEPAAKNAATLELFVAYGMQTSCSYCHELKGSPAGAAKAPGDLLHTLPTGYHVEPKPTMAAAAEGPTSRPATQSLMAAVTAPTTRPMATPEGRRWFAASVFNHDSHRVMKCEECHAQANGSSLTSDVLLPDVQSCTACHHSGGGENSKMATSNCITCHVYHDRARQGEPVKNRGMDLLLGKRPMVAAGK
jgi:predicted CXXCH cytochrome family protein